MRKDKNNSNLPPLPDFNPEDKSESTPEIESSFSTNPKREDVPKIEKEVSATEPTVSQSVENQDSAPVGNKTEPLPPQEKKNSNPAPVKKKSSQAILWGFAAIGAALVLTFYAMLFWGLLSGTASNPLFETLGIQAGELKNILINFTNFLFGFIALVLLIMTLAYTFRWAISAKTAINKRQLAISAGAYLFSLLITAGIWVFLYLVIVQSSGGPKSDIDNSLIQTQPALVTGLSSPVLVEFDIGERLYENIDQSLVKLINWDFDGDGQTDASGAKVTHRFLDKGDNEGRFPVTAEIFYDSTATGEELSFRSQREVIIENENVIASFTASPEAGAFPLDVEFNAAESRDPDGEIILYEWDLDGDGLFEISSREESNVFETFSKVGEYKVSLRVTGRNNDFNVTEKTIIVRTPDSDLRAVIASTDPLEGPPPLKVLLDGSQSFVKEGKIVKYEWFIEGETDPVPTRKIERVFREPGQYTVTLTVVNDLGERQQTERIIRVFEREVDPEVVIETTPALARRSNRLTGKVPFMVTFNGNKSQIKNPIDWEWDFQSDGIIDAYSAAVQHTFRTAGTYDTKLTITDSQGLTHTQTIEVVVEPAGTTAKITASPVAGPVPLEVEFDGSGSSTDDGEIVSYKWQFPGQPLQQKSAQVTYLFEQIGDFPVTMEILTSSGKRAIETFVVSVRAPDIEAEFEANPPVGSAPLEVTFTPKTSTGIVREYQWDFGDGQTARSLRSTPQVHRYTTAGEYEVQLKVIDQNNLVSTSTRTVTVKP